MGKTAPTVASAHRERRGRFFIGLPCRPFVLPAGLGGYAVSRLGQARRPPARWVAPSGRSPGRGPASSTAALADRRYSASYSASPRATYAAPCLSSA